MKTNINMELFRRYAPKKKLKIIEKAAEYIGNIIGKELPPSYADIMRSIEDHMEEHDNNEESWMSFHRYQVLDD